LKEGLVFVKLGEESVERENENVWVEGEI